MARPKTKTAAQSVSEYIKKTYHRFDVKVPKEQAAQFRAACEKNGTNPNRIINEWIVEYIGRAEQ